MGVSQRHSAVSSQQSASRRHWGSGQQAGTLHSTSEDRYSTSWGSAKLDPATTSYTASRHTGGQSGNSGQEVQQVSLHSRGEQSDNSDSSSTSNSSPGVLPVSAQQGGRPAVAQQQQSGVSSRNSPSPRSASAVTPHSESTTTSTDSTGSGTAQHYSNPESAKHCIPAMQSRQQCFQHKGDSSISKPESRPSEASSNSTEQRKRRPATSQHRHRLQHREAWNPAQAQQTRIPSERDNCLNPSPAVTTTGNY